MVVWVVVMVVWVVVMVTTIVMTKYNLTPLVGAERGVSIKRSQVPESTVRER